MTASEVVMKRDDPNIAWGFRLTGGSDLGTPFYVVKVLGRGHAERAGLRVGDLVYAINHKYINNYTHKDAQNSILHTGDTLILNIKRGPQNKRGTPLPEYVDPLMGIAPPPPTPRPITAPPPPYEPPAIIKEPTPPESEEEEEGGEDTVAAFNVKINPKGRIAAIEELPVTPPPSRSTSRSRSRSRSVSRDRRGSSKRASQQRGVENDINGSISGPGESFTYSKEVVTQYSTVLSSSNNSGGQTSETINESFIIHGGSDHKMEDVLSPDDIERDIFEEKMEEQKITELLTGEAELLDKGVVGINFQKIIPKTDFIKESNVFKELQEQCIKKEEPEEEQLKKDPTKRFSTFLQTPKRPIPKPKTKPPPADDLPWKKQFASPIPATPPPQPPQQITQNIQHTEAVQQEATTECHTTRTEVVNIVEDVSVQEVTEVREERVCEEKLLGVAEVGPIITEAVSTENVFEEKVHFEDETHEKKEERCSIEECKEQTISEEQSIETTTCSGPHGCSTIATTEYKSEFERQLAEIQKQLQSIQQLPTVLQANLAALQEQLLKVVEAKAAADQKELTSEPNDMEEEPDSQRQRHDSTTSQLKWKIDVTVEENKEECAEETAEEKIETAIKQETEEAKNIEKDNEDAEEIRVLQNEQYENMKNAQFHQREDDEMSVSKPPMIRNFPRSVAERPIVLPGGRKWYTPKDAYNEDFIAETIIHQSEVLVGSTIGLNFRKYEPPKFDAANSAVFRLIHELEERNNGGGGLPIEARPEKVLAEEDYCPPISKRHFFAARLAEQANENVEKILQETNEQDIVSV